MTAGLGETPELRGDPSGMRRHEELFWRLPEFQDLGQHGHFLVGVLDALGQNTDSAVKLEVRGP